MRRYTLCLCNADRLLPVTQRDNPRLALSDGERLLRACLRACVDDRNATLLSHSIAKYSYGWYHCPPIIKRARRRKAELEHDKIHMENICNGLLLYDFDAID